MKRLTIILTLFLLFLNCSYATDVKTVTKDYKTVTKDGFTIVSKLEYPKIKEKTNFSTVVLLHSLGYNSVWWETLPNDLLDKGYAVLTIDFRGHGKSIYNTKLLRVSWKNLKNKAFMKYPEDVITVIEYIKTENKRVFFDNWAFVGADIGAASAIIAANKIKYKPKTIVMLSPLVEAKGLYVPVNLAELSNIDILSVTGKTDLIGIRTNSYLKKFAQATYAEYTSDCNSNGMLMLKNDPTLSAFISSWISQYLK